MSARKSAAVTGNVALRALLDWDSDLESKARSVMEALLAVHKGNFAAAAVELGLEESTGRKHVRALVKALDLDEWLAREWPERRKGGTPMWRK